MTKSYQLTPHPVGTKREFWAMSWPLMLAMFSTSLMFFVDRLFLSRFDPIALNAAATGGMAYYFFLVLPMSIMGISEVLVGRLHGEKRYSEVGSAAWQMVWLSIFLIPIFLAIAWLTPGLIFQGSSIAPQETSYFSMLMYFAPFQCMVIALSGFYIGIGKVKVVTMAAILGNVTNIVLDYALIFGLGIIPSFGIPGAAFATGISEVIQSLFLFAMLFRASEKNTYHTNKFQFQGHFFKESLKIGTPAGLGRSFEIAAHFIFFRLVMSAGQAQMTIVAMVQSIYILSAFIIDAASRAASAIVANLLGAEQRALLKKVHISSFTLHTLYFILFAALILIFPDALIRLFISESHIALFADPALKAIFISSLFFMTLFFLFDGFSWLYLGFLTAAGDTRFIFWISLLVNFFAYLLPAFFLIGYAKQGANLAWAIIAGMGLVNVLIYSYRYYTGKWLKHYEKL